MRPRNHRDAVEGEVGDVPRVRAFDDQRAESNHRGLAAYPIETQIAGIDVSLAMLRFAKARAS